MLRVLGGAVLSGNTGRVTGSAAHRHPMALLALLATAPSAAMSREKLMALLWPEAGQREARHSLNVVVHTLRRAFGDDVIRTVGGDLQLDFALIPCDVAQYAAALARGDHATAVALYGGPFMDGFYLDGADDFERWQETERSRLATAYAGALGAVAAAAEARNDWAGAVDAWRRLAALEPGTSRVTARLMVALERAGDRAGALAAADAHVAHMQTEFNAQPAPEVTALATRIRSHPANAATTVEATPRIAADASETLLPSSPSSRDFTAPSRDGPPPAKRSVAAWLRPAVALLLLVAAIAFGRTRLMASRGRTPPLPPSLAVLPFVNMTGDSANQYLSDGLTEELLNALASVHGLRVAARTSSFLFRDRGADVRDIGRRLGVSAVVEGSVRTSGSHLRITAQLIDARTGYHMWSDEFDRPHQDILAMQRDVALAVTSALRVRLAEHIGEAVLRASTSSSEAHDLYFRGRFEWNRRTEPGMLAAKDAFERAIAIDPRYALAYAGLSDAWHLLPLYGHVGTNEGLANAKTAALRAVALDSSLAEAHTSLAVMYLKYDHDRASAEREYRRAIDINPGYATAHHWYALFLVAGGRFDEATVQVELARRVDPLSRIINAAAGTVRMFARDYESAIAEFRAILALEPNWATGLGLLGRAQAAAGRYDEAIPAMEKAVSISKRQPSHVALLSHALALAGRPNESRALLRELEDARPASFAPPVDLAAVYVALGRRDEAFRILNRGVDDRDEEMMYMKVDPRYDSIRADPRFARLLALLDLD